MAVFDQRQVGREPAIQTGMVAGNVCLCRDHYRLTFRVPSFRDALAGQFVHLCPEYGIDKSPHDADAAPCRGGSGWAEVCQLPMLRRAFSIAGLRRMDCGIELDVIYRVVGTATHWMQSLLPGGRISVLGPLGNHFPIHATKPFAWLVAGGVGLPPFLWLCEALHTAGKQSIAFCGAQRADLLALSIDPQCLPAEDATDARKSSREFTRHNVPVVISTDDGSLGLPGSIGEALTAYDRAHPTPAEKVVVYTCGPERMMHFVADFCAARGMECYVCMERSMACGMGTCQSCVVSVHDESDVAGWRYQLCCTDGPVFRSGTVLWPGADTHIPHSNA